MLKLHSLSLPLTSVSVVTGKIAKSGLADVITYLEVHPKYSDRLSTLFSIMEDVKSICCASATQTSMSDFCQLK